MSEVIEEADMGKKHNLDGHIGADPMFTHATHTGHSRAHVKHSHDHPKLKPPPRRAGDLRRQ